jgi:hypothetical protein
VTEPPAAGPVARPGDRYEWHGVEIEVGQVDGDWAVISCRVPGVPEGPLPLRVSRTDRTWEKQQPLTPGGRVPADWVPRP